jgi:glycerophosphoryl diester phosphodiesterase
MAAGLMGLGLVWGPLAPTAAVPVSPVGTASAGLVVGHRGASGYRPEHTLAAYELAVRQGADFIEPDLVSTKDHVLVCLHDVELSQTTDVADHPELAERRTTKVVNGRSQTGWFAEDLTLAEVKTLRARERLPVLRPDSAAHDGLFEVPTFAQVLALRAALARETGRPVGIYPELKLPTHFREVGLPLEPVFTEQLRAAGLDSATAPVFVQSFEPTSLRRLKADHGVRARLTFLSYPTGAPYDLSSSGDPRTYADLNSAAGLTWLSGFVSVVAAEQVQVVPRRADGTLGVPTALPARIRAAGLRLHVYALRGENTFLPVDYRVGTDPAAVGRATQLDTVFFKAGADALFCDQPDLCVAARRMLSPKRTYRPSR